MAGTLGFLRVGTGEPFLSLCRFGGDWFFQFLVVGFGVVTGFLGGLLESILSVRKRSGYVDSGCVAICPHGTITGVSSVVSGCGRKGIFDWPGLRVLARRSAGYDFRPLVFQLKGTPPPPWALLRVVFRLSVVFRPLIESLNNPPAFISFRGGFLHAFYRADCFLFVRRLLGSIIESFPFGFRFL